MSRLKLFSTILYMTNVISSSDCITTGHNYSHHITMKALIHLRIFLGSSQICEYKSPKDELVYLNRITIHCRGDYNCEYPF